MRQDVFDPISQRFRDNLIDNIAMANGSEASGRLRRKSFRDKGNVGIIYFLEQSTRVEKRKSS